MNMKTKGDIMGGRYWITGAQLGIIKANLTSMNVNEAIRTIEQIENEQFIVGCPTDDDKKRFKNALQMIRGFMYGS
jgi:hypothetical protein